MLANQLPFVATRCSLIISLLLAGACSGGLVLRPIDASVQKPSNVAVYFTVETGDGEPVAGLTAESFRIYEDGSLVSVHESKQTILNPEIATDHFTLLLVDMSGSVTESDDVPTIISASTAFADRLSKYQKVGVYTFDGSKEIRPLSNFATSPDQVRRGIARLDSYKAKDPSTNLNGAIVEALKVLDQQIARSNMPLRFGTLVVFTDGSDRAARVTRDQVANALDQTEYEVYVIGVGSEIDSRELSQIGRTGAIIRPKREELSAAFEEAAARIEAMSKRFYLLGYCSPSRAGRHKVTIEASAKGGSGDLSYEFTADGFRPNCDPEQKPNFNLKRPKAARVQGQGEVEAPLVRSR